MQRLVRGYLARRDYIRMKHGALNIQSAYRGYRVRREYNKMRKGMVALQAVYRCVPRKMTLHYLFSK